MENKDLNLEELNLNTLNLKFANCAMYNPTILIDNKKIKTKKDNFGNLTYTHKTNQKNVEIKIIKYFDILGPLWFLSSLFFFIISLFGILDVRPDKKCLTLDSTIKINIERESELKVILKSRKKDEQALEFETNNCELISSCESKYFVDTIAQKRYKIMKVTKIILWVLLIAGLISLLFLI